MQTCDNCAISFDSTQEGVVVSSKTSAVCGICDACLTNARLIKLVVRRSDVGKFTYEQFSVIETVGVMSSAPKSAGWRPSHIRGKD